jgi:D-alanyl-lipoteichoic acid acyltransferase DltB (MBOAT superfamily)
MLPWQLYVDYPRLVYMLFTSLQFIVFLPIVVALYWVLPRQLRLPMLLLASYIFYMSWIPAFLLLILPMTLFNWLWGKVLSKSTRPKMMLAVGVAVNLLILSTFKYTGFFAGSIESFASLLSLHADINLPNIILPLGISFFTFEFIHYLVEIYRGNEPVKSFVSFALFAAFFPTQIAGPIKRYKDFLTQIEAQPPLKLAYFQEGLPLIVIGMAKKLLLADSLSILVQMGLSQPARLSGAELWICIYAFAFQIYFDFCGYTDIARGSALLFGNHIPLNFNSPYIAGSITEFWHRWHISLSTWLRDYLFIPLGGSRGGKWMTYRNLFLTMALGGLWHGASWNFVVWGVFHGCALIIHREFTLLKEVLTPLRSFWQSSLWKLAAVLLTFHAVCIGWVFFRVQDIGDAFLIVQRMLTLAPSPSSYHQLLLFKPDLPVLVPTLVGMVAALMLINIPLSQLKQSNFFARTPAYLVTAYCAFLILVMVGLFMFSPNSTAPFIYFQF